MAFEIPFFKSKKAAKPSPPITPALPSPAAATPPGQSKPNAPFQGSKIIPRQGSLAAALKAAEAGASVSSKSRGIAAQSANFKPTISVFFKSEKANISPSSTPGADAQQPPPLPIPTLPPGVSDTIKIPTSEIMGLLPENILRPEIQGSFPDTISLSISEILPQLPKGRVQFPLNALLSSFPPEAVNASIANSSGGIKIKIPLHLIIPKLPETAISLPSDQIKQQVDANIETPFSERKAKAEVQQPVVLPVKIPPSIPSPAATAPSQPAPVLPAIKKPVIDLTKRDPLPAIIPPAKPMVTGASVPKINLASLPILPPIPKLPLPPIPPAPKVSKEAAPPAANVSPSLPKLSEPIQSPKLITPASPQISLPKLSVPKIPTPIVPPTPVHVEKAPLKASTPPPAAALPPIPVPRPPSVSQSSPTPTIPKPVPILSPKPPLPASMVPAAVSDSAKPPLSDWEQLVGISEGRELRIQEIAEKIRSHFGLIGVLIATKDGLPLVGAMPPELDSHAWSSIGLQLFRKFGEGDKLSLGERTRCLLSVKNFWITVLHEGEIYLIIVHRLEDITPQFEERNMLLLRGIAKYCSRQRAPN